MFCFVDLERRMCKAHGGGGLTNAVNGGRACTDTHTHTHTHTYTHAWQSHQAMPVTCNALLSPASASCCVESHMSGLSKRCPGCVLHQCFLVACDVMRWHLA